MPLVQLRYREVVPDDVNLVQTLSKDVLPFEVARNLNIDGIEEAHLTPADIVVWVSSVNCMDVQEADFEVIVDAHDFPERRKRVQKAADSIREEVKRVVGEKRVAVWIRLFPTGYSEG